MNEQVQKSSSAAEKTKNKLSKRLVKEASTKKSWKTILKQVFKITFNTSAIVGIISTVVITATKLNVVPRSVKNDIAGVVKEYKNPISEAFLDKSSCFVENWHPDMRQYKDDEEYKKYCITVEQHRENERYNVALRDKFSDLGNNYLNSGFGSSESAGYYTEYYESLINSINDKCFVNKSLNELFGYNTLHFNITYEQGLTWLKEYGWKQTNTCYGREFSNIIFELTGERLPYYDQINGQVIYGEEQ